MHIHYVIACKNYVKANNTKGKRSGKCFICGKRRHYTCSCQQKFKSPENSYITYALSSNNNNNHKSISKNYSCVDSGATSHMCNNRRSFTSITEYKEQITVAGNQFVLCEGRGGVQIKTAFSTITLKNTLYVVPSLQINFFP